MIPQDDRGFTLGDGLFETVLVSDGMLQAWDMHLSRLTAACELIGLVPPDPIACLELCRSQASSIPKGLAALRLTYTAGSGGRGLDRPQQPMPRMVVSMNPYERNDASLHLTVSHFRRNSESPSARLKTLGYLDNILVRRTARMAGADDSVILDTHDRICCSSAGNLFWVRAGRIETPGLDCAILPGTMRDYVLDRARKAGIQIDEVSATSPKLSGIEAMIVTNSLVGAQWVSQISDRLLARDQALEPLVHMARRIRGPD
jgi:branched-subunit amino acid aminotransferase/4-amino-4-deoxychorismate lyase